MGRGARVGLEITSTCVRAAEIHESKGIYRLERIGQLGIPDGAVRDGIVVNTDAVSAALRELWSTVGFSTKVVTMGVGSGRVVVRLVDVPWMPPGDLRSSLPLVIGDSVPIPADQAVMDLLALEERTVDGQRMLHGLLVAAAEEMLMNNVEAVRAAGLRPLAIDLSGFAMLRALTTVDALGMQPIGGAIVDVGARVTSVIVHVGGRPQFVRLLSMGGADVTERLMDVFNITLPQAEDLKRQHSMADPTGIANEGTPPSEVIGEVLTSLIDEIRSSLEYYSATTSGARLESVTLSGGVARTGGFASRLSSSVGLPVDYALPLTRVELGNTGLAPEQLAFLEPMAAVPVGLAMVAA